MKHRDDTEQITPMFTDEPVLVLQPRRRLRRILVLYALLPLICGGVGAYIAYELANWRTDQRVDALEADLAGRRAQRAAEDQARDARLAQTRRDLCVVLDRLPRDAEVQEMRRRYGCTGAASPGPGPTVTPARPPAAPSGQPGAGQPGAGSGGVAPAGGAAAGPSGPRGGTGPAGPTGQPAPSPRPPSTTSPPPAPEPTDGLSIDVCVPLLELCVNQRLSADVAVEAPPAP